MNALNELLDNIELRKDGRGDLEIFNKGTDEKISPEAISSGETELIFLAIECLCFGQECKPEQTNVLLLDSPDVHLHQDAQDRLIHFIRALAEEKKFYVVIAAHSTAFFSASPSYVWMSRGQKTLTFKKMYDYDAMKGVLSAFGAHALSSLFNFRTVLLREGEDDVRIWGQVARSSNGNLKLYPVGVNGLGNMNKYEIIINEIVTTMYDRAIVLSLRDGDGKKYGIDNHGQIRRFRLNCRSSENLLLTTEVLEHLGTTWDLLLKAIDAWLEINESHPNHTNILKFKEEGYDRQNFDLKDIRNDIMHIIGSKMAWEVAIGKTLGKIFSNTCPDSLDQNSICKYLGEKLISELFSLSQKNHAASVCVRTTACAMDIV